MGVANRDIKLENTLLDGSPKPLVKITDFGYCKSDQESLPKSKVGTPGYTGKIPARDTIPGCLFCCLHSQDKTVSSCNILRFKHSLRLPSEVTQYNITVGELSRVKLKLMQDFEQA